MTELQRQEDERARWIKSQQEKKEQEEKKRQDDEARAREERERVDKKAFEQKKTDQERSYDESKRLEEKRREEKRDKGRGDEKERAASAQTDKKEQVDVKTSTSDKNQFDSEKSKSTQSAGQDAGWTADQTPFVDPENKPSFATPKRDDAKLEKPTTLAERTAIRNMDKAVENERAGRTRPPAHTVERAEQAEAKLQQAHEVQEAKKKHQSPAMEKSQ